MEFLKQNAEKLNMDDDNPYKWIEYIARTCYKSESKIKEGSDVAFVKRLINNKHFTMLEHMYYTFTMTVPFTKNGVLELHANQYINYIEKCPFVYVNSILGSDLNDDRECCDKLYIVTCNVRTLNEYSELEIFRDIIKAKYPNMIYSGTINEKFSREMIDDLKKCHIEIVPSSKFNCPEGLSPALTTDIINNHKFVTYKFTTNRGVTHELVRHRIASYAMESTRYINYKNGISVCLPELFDFKSEEVRNLYITAWEAAEKAYCELVKMGESAQEARRVLPIATKAEIIMTTNIKEWLNVIQLRYFGITGAPHPDVKELIGYSNLLQTTIFS